MLHDWKTIEYIVISLLVLWIVAGMFAANCELLREIRHSTRR